MTIHIVWLQVYIPYLLKLKPRLLLCLCLERCCRLFEGSYYSRVANIYRVHVHYCPHDKLRQVDEAFCFASIVCRQHVYKMVWTPFLGEILIANPEPKNNHNRHAVCVKKNGEIVGHVPGIECSLLYSGHSYHVFALGGVGAAPLIITMNVIKSGTYLRAATILLPSSWIALSIRGQLLNGVWRPFK